MYSRPQLAVVPSCVKRGTTETSFRCALHRSTVVHFVLAFCIRRSLRSSPSCFLPKLDVVKQTSTIAVIWSSLSFRSPVCFSAVSLFRPSLRLKSPYIWIWLWELAPVYRRILQPHRHRWRVESIIMWMILRVPLKSSWRRIIPIRDHRYWQEMNRGLLSRRLVKHSEKIGVSIR